MRRMHFDGGSLVGLCAAAGVVVLAQMLEGGSARSLWQPTSALVVFGGTMGAVLLSYPVKTIGGTLTAVWQVFIGLEEPLDSTIMRIAGYAQHARRKGTIGLESEIDRASEPFLRSALTLAVDGTSAETTRHILEIEHHARREGAELPAEVLETAAGYTPTLGILGAVLGLIHVMESLTEPNRLASGIAVAFVATVYGVAAANLVLLPLATKLRGQARRSALYREVVIEGMAALQEGLNPRLIEQKLHGYLTTIDVTAARRRAA